MPRDRHAHPRASRVVGGAGWEEVLPSDLPPVSPAYFDRSEELLRLDQNTNPRTPPVVAEAGDVARRAVLHTYGSARGGRLRAALARTYGVEPDQVLVGNGSDEVLDTVARAYLRPGRRAARIRPGYDLHAFFVLREGAQLRELPTEPFDPGGPLAAGGSLPPGFLEGIDVLYHSSPHNPTGGALPPADVGGWADQLSPGLLVMDEAYAEYDQARVVGPGPAWAQGLARGNVLFTRTFSKAWGLAGLRVGWAVGPREVIARLERFRIPYTLGSFPEEMAAAALADPGFVEASVQEVRTERPRLARALERRGFRVLPSRANFLFTYPPIDGAALFTHLRGQGILVRCTGPTPSCPQPLRVSVGTPEQSERLLEALDRGPDGPPVPARAPPAVPRGVR